MKRGTNYFKAHQNMAFYDSNSIYIITVSVYLKSSYMTTIVGRTLNAKWILHIFEIEVLCVLNLKSIMFIEPIRRLT